MKPSNEATAYLDRSQPREQVMATRLADDAAKIQNFKLSADAVRLRSLDPAQLGYELGMSFQEYHLPASAELAENYFNAHYGPALGVSFSTFRFLISASRKTRERRESMSDVMPALKQLLFASDLLQRPHAREHQVARSVPPYSFFINALGQFRSDGEKKLRDSASWDGQTRESIREELKKACAWLGCMEILLSSNPAT